MTEKARTRMAMTRPRARGPAPAAWRLSIIPVTWRNPPLGEQQVEVGPTLFCSPLPRRSNAFGLLG